MCAFLFRGSTYYNFMSKNSLCKITKVRYTILSHLWDTSTCGVPIEQKVFKICLSTYTLDIPIDVL